MGELIVGRPAPKQLFAVSAPLEVTSAISLTFRAGGLSADELANSGYDPWLFEAWRAMDSALKHELELVLGFSGRLMYYIEELLFAFDGLNPDRIVASFDEFLAFLQSLSPQQFQEMAGVAISRVYLDRGLRETPPDSDDVGEWRMFVRPGITRASIDEVAALLTSPQMLKDRTIAVLRDFWDQCYAAEYAKHRETLERAVRFGQALAHPSVQVTFQELTDHRMPGEIEAWLDEVDLVVFCPSTHVARFIQYVHYPPRLILYFNPANVLQSRPLQTTSAARGEQELDTDDVLDGLRAISDPSRMRIIGMLREGELYAQEIVARLEISQSAVSRHLGTLESADLVTVRPANGMKYYAIDRARLRALANYVEGLADIGAP